MQNIEYEDTLDDNVCLEEGSEMEKDEDDLHGLYVVIINRFSKMTHY